MIIVTEIIKSDYLDLYDETVKSISLHGLDIVLKVQQELRPISPSIQPEKWFIEQGFFHAVIDHIAQSNGFTPTSKLSF